MDFGCSTDEQHVEFIKAFKEEFYRQVESQNRLNDVMNEVIAASNRQIPSTRMDEVAAAIFNYAVDVAMQKAIPVFLDLLKDQDMGFVEELRRVLTIDWMDEWEKNQQKSAN